jgi:hypothetical protein
MRTSVAWSLALAIGSWAASSAAQTAVASPEPQRTAPPYYELYPEHLPYRNGDPIPAGYQVETNTNRTWPIVTGSITIGVFYLYGLLSVRSAGDQGAEWMLAPVIGPSALLLTNSKHCDPRCHGMDLSTVVITAVGQAGGAALVIWGLSSWRMRLVREDLVHPQAFVAPMPVGSGYGLGALGSF